MSRCNFSKDDGVWVCQTCGVAAPYFTGDNPAKMFRQCPATPVVQWRGSPRESTLPPLANTRPAGPGTELKHIIAKCQKLLPWWDMQPRKGCGCNDTAAWMDRLGPDGCVTHLDEIVDRLEEEAARRKIRVPFRRAVARRMVRWAIRRARRSQHHQQDRQDDQ